LLFIAAILWTTAYDTIYALIDRPYDLKIGVKSTAILFGELDRVITGIIQALFLFVMLLLGLKLKLDWWYYLGLMTAAGLFVWQLAIIEDRDPENCFKAFISNNWVGMAIFIGLLAAYL
jgi:4-hydroxybenzoate polyprenyltransferase